MTLRRSGKTGERMTNVLEDGADSNVTETDSVCPFTTGTRVVDALRMTGCGTTWPFSMLPRILRGSLSI